ncbi:MAG: hypothetical protein HDR09_20210 [Lachnospiraceae bacterium]|nr:hypothetical protein [Lachnospiraceae bacterium]MBD5506000.1 hypothetical protein [Lachnospiraceae bacterium]
MEVELQKCREELEKKTMDAKRNHLRWAYEKAKKEYEAYERRIEDLRGFIYSAEKEIKRQKAEDSGENA